jgi:hypothetical protein
MPQKPQEPETILIEALPRTAAAFAVSLAGM